MVRNKMEQREYIILCLEDSNDWSNATSRRLVMQASQRRHAQGFCRHLKVCRFWEPAAGTYSPGVAVDLKDSANDSNRPPNATSSCRQVSIANQLLAALQADVTVTALIAEDLIPQSTDATSMGRLSPAPRMA